MFTNACGSLVVACVLGLAALAGIFPIGVDSARADTILVSANPFGGDCEMNNTSGPGLRTVYVYHQHAGSLGTRLRVALDVGVTMNYISETHPFPMTVGNTQDGLSVCYGSCLPPDGGPVAVITYMYLGQTFSCPSLRVVPHPDAETVEVITCDGKAESPSLEDLPIPPPNGSCGCGDRYQLVGVPHIFDCAPLPVESKTWGAIKALYRH
jgi:hypothetical protein